MKRQGRSGRQQTWGSQERTWHQGAYFGNTDGVPQAVPLRYVIQTGWVGALDFCPAHS